jgi:MFS family permease
MAAKAGTRDRWLWTAGASVSFLGDGAFWLAVGIWVKDMTGSNGRAALAMFCYLAPRMLSPLTGLFADRFRRRSLLLVVYLLMAAEVLAVLLVHGAGQVWLVYAVLAGLGLGSGLAAAAGSALLTVLVPGGELGRANAVLRTAKELGLLVAPVAGAGLYALAGAHLVAILESGTFVLAAGCVAALRLREPRPERRRSALRTELVAGVRHVARTPVLRHVLTAAGAAMLALGIFEALVYAIVDDDLHRPPAFLGVLAAVQGIGSVTGGLAAIRLACRHSERWLVVVGLFAIAAGTAAMLLPGLLPALAGVLVIGLGAPVAVVGLFTALQRYTPGELQGRVAGAADTMITVPQVLSIALGAALVTVLDYRVLLAGIAVAVAGSAGWLAGRRVFDGQPAPAAGTVGARVPDAGIPGSPGAGRDAAADAAGLEPVHR